MSKVSGKMKFWTKGFVISFFFLILSALLIVLLIISHIFLPIPWIDLLYKLLRPWLLAIFYNYNLYIYGGILISYSLLLVLYVLGYNLAKVKHMTGSIIYVFSLLGFVLVTFIAVHYTYASILFNQDLFLNVRLMLLLLFLPMTFALSLFLLLVNIDFSIFFKDLFKARKIWKHRRPEFEIEVKGKITYINIKTDEFVFTPVPMLIIAKYLQSKGYSVSWFVRGAFNHLISLIITYLTGWPRARNMLFRFTGMKISKNCSISQRALPDPLLPELIEFEEGSGCGIGVKLLTHNAMNIQHGSFSFGPIKICKNARIGAYSVILPGVTIGEGSIIGANSLVSDDIPPFSIAFGSPAKVIRPLTDSEKEEVNKNYRANL
jgi:carbonic anhydrase/acetyltransferase-like protein (isoleucine patch superfamily)